MPVLPAEGSTITLPGPDLSGDGTGQGLSRDIMVPHCGVLLYRNRPDADETAPQIAARRSFPEKLRADRPDLAELTEPRLQGNRRMQKLLKDPAAVQDYPAGGTNSPADCFAAAALARFTIHGLAGWRAGSALEGCFARMKARPGFAGRGDRHRDRRRPMITKGGER